MNCPECEGKMSMARVNRLYADGKILIENVEVSKCASCDFEIVGEKEYERIRKIVQDVQTNVPAAVLASAKMFLF
ncbi:hypothetical protein HZC09_00950 [Candidatus Micrarchaeota archaeon]|nr:hypothetical protein [Candidatus Micrarchaeota archaeon]